MMRVPMTAMWSVALALVLVLSWHVQAGCDDGIGCDFILKTTRCEGSNYDISFALDRSSSMEYGAGEKGQNTGQVSCPETLTSYNCIRRDVMRFVLRQVMLEMFLKFQLPCLEYRESKLYKDSKKDCVARKFTQTRFHVVWWHGKKTSTVRGQQFDGPWGSQDVWNKELTDYFWDTSSNSESGYIIKSNMWNTNGENPKLKRGQIKKWFETKFLADNANYPYPKGDGATYPSFGLKKVAAILKQVYAMDYKEQPDSSFPVFFMTDGVVSKDASPEDLPDSIQNIADAVDDDDGDKVKKYGLGLTGNSALRNQQIDLFKEHGFEYESPTTGQQYFFSQAGSSKIVVEEIVKSIQENCRDCWTKGDKTICDKIGSRDRTDADFEDDDKDVTKPTPKTVNTIGSDTLVVNTEILFDDYVLLKDKLFTIPSNTRLCWKVYTKDKKTNMFGTNGYKFTEYTKDNECDCCKNVEALCLCDYRRSSNFHRRVMTLVPGKVYQEVPVYSENSNLYKEMKLRNANVGNSDFPETKIDSGDSDSGETDEEEEDDNDDGDKNDNKNTVAGDITNTEKPPVDAVVAPSATGSNPKKTGISDDGNGAAAVMVSVFTPFLMVMMLASIW